MCVQYFYLFFARKKLSPRHSLVEKHFRIPCAGNEVDARIITAGIASDARIVMARIVTDAGNDSAADNAGEETQKRRRKSSKKLGDRMRLLQRRSEFPLGIFNRRCSECY